jgi:hypothetical protein
VVLRESKQGARLRHCPARFLGKAPAMVKGRTTFSSAVSIRCRKAGAPFAVSSTGRWWGVKAKLDAVRRRGEERLRIPFLDSGRPAPLR